MGIGGIGMSGIAAILLDVGCKVSGSDLKDTKITRNLKHKGAIIFKGHNAKNIKGAQLVVVSTAIPSGNPEILAAVKNNIPVVQRACVLGHLMNSKFGIAVSGTHGKTTTASMIAHVLEHSGLDPTIAIGGYLCGLDFNAKLGKSKFFVAEADESDASFLNLNPKVAVITNLDTDINLNSDYFSKCNFKHEKVLARVTASFKEFIKKITWDGKVIFCSDCKNISKAIPKVRKNYISYGIENKADFFAREVKYEGYATSSKIFYKNKFLGNLFLNIPGKHNILNALATIALGMELGLNFKEITEALFVFRGVKRRFQVFGVKKDIMVVDDYAHNPSKIKAALDGVGNGSRRIIAVFQPHRYTRTKLLFDEFGKCFSGADILIVTKIYSAGEKPIEGISGKKLAEEVKKYNKSTKVVYLPVKNKIFEYLHKNCSKGDLVMTLGAGDIYKVAEKFYNSIL